MRLLRLELAGFKSFPDKTSLDFVQDGVSIVVGPNGCGKSNIVDAIRWALGEQSAKHLRGAAMEDVIFAGSSSRSQVGLAQVSLVFANPTGDSLHKYHQYNEISVTRKLYRTGESQYQINKTLCRLGDIRELFMDTGIGGKGYSIIEQGKIDRIVTSGPQERRALVDEAAGIVKFKTKKLEAQKRFITSRANLERVEDVLRELRLQEEKLAVQVAKADQYSQAKGRMERLSQLGAAYSWAKLKDQGEKLLAEREVQLSTIKDLELVLTNLGTQKVGLGLEQSLHQTKREELGSKLSKSREELIKLESRIEKDQESLRHFHDWQARGNRELEQLGEQIDALMEQEEALDEANEAVKAELAHTENAITGIRQEIRQAQENISALEQAHKGYLKLQSEAQMTLGGKKGEIEAQAARLKEAKAKGEEAQELLILAAERLFLAQEKRADTTKEAEGKNSQRSEVAERLKLAKAKQDEKKAAFEIQVRKIEEQERENHKAQSRFESLKQLQQNHEDFAPKIKAFLDHLAAFPQKAAELGFVGPLADLVEVGGKLESWAQNLLGRFFNLLVFESHYHLPQLKALMEELQIEYLEVYFLDLCEPAKSNLDYLIPWHNKPAGMELMGHYQAFEKRSFQIEPADLKTGRNLLLTDKSLLTKEGVFHLGLPGEAKMLEGYLARQQEFHQLSDQLKEQKQKLDDLIYDKGWLKEELDDLEWELTDLTQQHQQLEMESKELAKDLERANQEVERLEADRHRLEEAKERQQALDQELAQRRLSLEAEISEAQGRLDALAATLEAQANEIDKARLALEFKKGELQQAEVTQAGLKEKSQHQKELQGRMKEDLIRLRTKLGETKTQAEDQGKQREELEKAIETHRLRQPELVMAIQSLETDYKAFSEQLETQGHKIRELEEAEKAERAKTEAIKEKTHQQDLKLAQVAQEGLGIEQKLFEEWALRPAEILALDTDSDYDAATATKEIAKLKARLSDLGDVHLGARKEYDELKVRLDFLEAESLDLNQSIQALEESIQKIDEESRRRFEETFGLLNKEFKVLFPKLFGGGEAFLRLSDPADLLESGVEIIAQPPGKKLQNMTLLSGGEKAMTALSLIFSIFQIKPSPFCLLDEVDAPLDEANNRRFSAHVRSLTTNSQFIIITHNKQTMEIGDAMFGVTMEEPGASKLVSVDFETGKRLVEKGHKKGA
ncbi:MAG: chromosome segregation protein SMC [Candidatus Lambdaproteobacteria bacterium RIFOXYD1_FULL_56_27]|uniref:Chromosome partition protein Smc n=1 Tax=Candidatus Lambdaproteobacteria bacterium RIFOXYD2_FULL_56_26 TaxID=1817773 RepID=A0A1F6H3X1_9PROT|nr:MAG: chromosome segregation protein SMC [Candidatus Lambdaproteobacteria bacterium RIFOXYC1_FULL_56_13]OGH05053.1 MAG: chromosome segregation protein SMC [Candidatus Lambdaproteobacteria bacterium RIFOXYD2_FULL_56_26]OGH09518.1 MAG: chromosome segregation protein SMC [Candidatus Lambdaproteobacteria bacterium RIFOXYD1_FULL_56_27]